MSTDVTPIQVGPPARPERARNRHAIPSWVLKTTMAVSGALWAAFLAIHLFGNLKVFSGPEDFNGYAAWLKHAFYPLLPKGFVLWALRIALIASFFAHVVSGFMIWARARRARGTHRAKLKGVRSWGSWLMPATGVAIVVFLVIHLLDMTIGAQPVATQHFEHPEPGTAYAYENLVNSFARPLSAWFYVAIMVLLAAHIAKGFTTMASDLGVMGRRWRAALVTVGGLLAVAILLGNAAIPVLVQLGVLA